MVALDVLTGSLAFCSKCAVVSACHFCVFPLVAVNAAMKVDISFLTEILTSGSKIIMQAANIGQGIADVVISVVDTIIGRVDDIIRWVNDLAIDFLTDVSTRAHQVVMTHERAIFSRTA